MNKNEQNEQLKTKKLKTKKLKFLKEYNIKYDVQVGGCSTCGMCSHWC